MSSLSLEAALRDVEARRPEARSVAIRELAPALLTAAGSQAPARWQSIVHPKRDEVAAALDQACTDAAPQNAALARVGLAQIGAPTARARAEEALAAGDSEALSPADSDHAAMFMRECGVIALSLLGAAARAQTEADAVDVASAGEYAELLAALRALLDDPRDDVRFQAGPALVEVGGREVEAELVAALAREDHEEVRENLIVALSMFDPPGPAACEALSAVLGDEALAKGPLGWEAALALAGARRPEAAPRLILGLGDQSTRDRALEALAVIGPRIDPEDAPAVAEAVRRSARALFASAFTKVRAAYALARIDPPAGEAMLRKLEGHLRPSVREAAAEARALLTELAAEDSASGVSC
ncbi:HEAT repeat domain-containing protein [Pseudenhygromyxa sp. WMMC2535]|uniref:HEAT repeat domain-containing protein n=1 Tax=Pseudenhygromyxa sp. WMMC2535 TaxID=2712867 RepID=UPI001555DA3F|nr:HEAT repeat domain-containing protein [Pseudenhygromyxa sp. WMMC2535]NVB40909.1 HEAT repeat domain-containing protein [Pseudenhygromyxa sp. WMMC2535]